MATHKAKASLQIRRFIGFLNVFKRNKRGLVGVMILAFFSITAAFATIIAPYDPVSDSYIAGDFAAPFWFRNLPGGENLNENFQLEVKPGFTTSDSLDEWQFTASTSTAQVSMQYIQTFGYTNPGCVAITFRRDAGTYAHEVKTHLTKQFNYPYNSPPMKFTCQIAALTEGIEDLDYIIVGMYINRIENESSQVSYPLWTKKMYSTITEWELPQPPIDSYASKAWVEQYFGTKGDPAKIIFTKPGTYVFDIEIVFTDEKPNTLHKNIEATVYIDNLNVIFKGTTFGLLGTDYCGRDIFSQLVWGSQISIFVGLLSAVLSVGIGLMVGLISGYLGKVVDEILMRITDALIVLPGLPLLLVLVAVLGPSIWNLIFLIGVLGWMGFARMVRSMVLSLKERPFIEAARAVGAGKFHIIGRHVLPNVMSLVYVSLALSVPAAILSEASLSWLGLFDPTLMSWGRMLHDVTMYSGYEKYWWVLPPGICIAAISVSFILLGYALDEVLNPRLRKRR